MDIVERLKNAHAFSIIDEDLIEAADEIERLQIHYDGAIMYGNRLVDLIEWAEKNGIVFPAKIYNPCVIAFEHFRNERKRLKETDDVSK